MKPEALLARLRAGHMANVSLHDLERLAVACGWRLVRITGSHRIYQHDAGAPPINLQRSRSGDAKKYQVKDLLDLIEQFDLRLRDER